MPTLSMTTACLLALACAPAPGVAGEYLFVTDSASVLRLTRDGRWEMPNERDPQARAGRYSLVGDTVVLERPGRPSVPFVAGGDSLWVKGTPVALFRRRR